jgi:hypothetical protein
MIALFYGKWKRAGGELAPRPGRPAAGASPPRPQRASRQGPRRGDQRDARPCDTPRRVQPAAPARRTRLHQGHRLEVADLDRGGLATPFTATTCAVTYLLAQPPPLGAAGALVLSAPPLAHGAAGAAVLSADGECLVIVHNLRPSRKASREAVPRPRLRPSRRPLHRSAATTRGRGTCPGPSHLPLPCPVHEPRAEDGPDSPGPVFQAPDRASVCAIPEPRRQHEQDAAGDHL